MVKDSPARATCAWSLGVATSCWLGFQAVAVAERAGLFRVAFPPGARTALGERWHWASLWTAVLVGVRGEGGGPQFSLQSVPSAGDVCVSPPPAGNLDF